ncbi:hypothetical protein Ptc2401_00793 [Prosthecochloris sp. CIB 2401]|nr:hypothetical protein Ptc2401_00793 [Prosthecochloris sp. CIB 2401]
MEKSACIRVFPGLSACLLAADVCARSFNHVELSFRIFHGQYHALGEFSADFALGEVGDHHHLLAYQLFWLVGLGDTCQDLAGLGAEAELELEQLVGLFDLFGCFYGGDAKIDFEEVVEADLGGERGYCGWSGCRFFFLHRLEQGFDLLHFGGDIGIEDFPEEDFRAAIELVAFWQDWGSGVVPCRERLEVEHVADFSGGVRDDGLEEDAEGGAEVERERHGSACGILVRFYHLPRFALGEEAVGFAGDLHGEGGGFAEVKPFVGGFDGGEGLVPVDTDTSPLLFRTLVRHDAVEPGVGEVDRALDEVAEGVGQFAVGAVLEVLPAEVAVLVFGVVHGNAVAERVCREAFEELAEVDGVVARLGELAPFEVHELGGGDVVGQGEGLLPFLAAALFVPGHEERREHKGVEDHVVFADEVDDSGVVLLPVAAPELGVVLCLGPRFGE